MATTFVISLTELTTTFTSRRGDGSRCQPGSTLTLVVSTQGDFGGGRYFLPDAGVNLGQTDAEVSRVLTATLLEEDTGGEQPVSVICLLTVS